MCSNFMAVFYKCAEKNKEKTKKLSKFLKAYISGIAWASYFKFGM